MRITSNKTIAKTMKIPCKALLLLHIYIMNDNNDYTVCLLLQYSSNLLFFSYGVLRTTNYVLSFLQNIGDCGAVTIFSRLTYFQQVVLRLIPPNQYRLLIGSQVLRVHYLMGLFLLNKQKTHFLYFQ